MFERTYQGLRVREAKHDIILRVTDDDVAAAKRRDPENCALAQCAKRMFHVPRAIFFRQICYVQLPEEKTGEQVLYRFLVSSKARRDIVKFDLTGEVAPGGYHLLAPRASNTLNAMSEYNREHPRSSWPKRGATLKGTRKTLADVDPDWLRNGTGMVHFEAAKVKRGSRRGILTKTSYMRMRKAK